jgi:hypothetical protein
MCNDFDAVCAPSAGRRPRRAPRRLLVTALVSFTGMALVPAAVAQSYSGTTAQWAKLTAKVSSGMLTSFATSTGRLQTCAGQPVHDSSGDPVDVRLSGPAVPIVGGAFHLEGATVDDWKDPFTFTVDGKVSRDGREVTGTITAGGDTVFAKACTGTWAFDAVLPPRGGRPQIGHMYTAKGASFANVAFDYRRGVVTHLSARVGVECPGGSVFSAMVDTHAYRLDPIRVSKQGRFHLTAGVLDDYGVVNHYVITGRVKGDKASGHISSWRLYDQGNVDGVGVVKCHRAATWHATLTPTAKAPAAVTAAPTAFYDVVPYRYGRTGAWSYYIIVKLTGCAGASTVSVVVSGGPRQTAACHGQAKLGPLTPKRTYRVTESGRRSSRRRAAPAT